MRQFTDNIPGILGEHDYQCCSSHPTHSRRQYRDYIIDLYGVKDSTMSYSKCAMPSLSCLLSFYTISISLFFIRRILYFLVYIMYVCTISYTHKIQVCDCWSIHTYAIPMLDCSCNTLTLAYVLTCAQV